MEQKKCLRKFILYVLIVAALSLQITVFFGSNVHAADTVTRAEWIRQLVETFHMTVEDNNYPDNYFRDLDASSDYYYDILLAVQFGVIDVEAGGSVYPEGNVTREFAADTLNFCLGFQLDKDAVYTFTDFEYVDNADSAQVAINRGWFKLINGKFSPKTNITEDENKFMIEDAQTVWASTDIDDNYNNTYEFASDIIEIPEETQAYLLDDGRIYIADVSTKILEQDKIAVYLNGIPCVYLVDAVENVGGDIIITGTEVDHEEAEYAIVQKGEGTDIITWQRSTVFNGLGDAMAYTVYARIASTDEESADEIGGRLDVITMAESPYEIDVSKINGIGSD